MIAGKRVVVSGKIEGESRASAQQKLMEAGATVQSSFSKETDVLIVGVRPGPEKLKTAARNGIEVVPWHELWERPAVPVTVIDARGVSEGVLTSDERGDVIEMTPPRQIGPMLAKSDELPPSNGDWLFEVKWDGLRCTATVKNGLVWMQSRSGKSEYNATFPEVADQLRHLPDCIVDGELVVLDSEGNSFGMTTERGKAQLVLFDLLELDGNDLRKEPLSTRRTALEFLLLANQELTRLAMSPDFDDGEQLLAWCAERGLEGLVAKNKWSTYREGSRSRDWIKVKVRNEQEFVVVGWTEGKGARSGQVGSMLLAYYDDEGGLHYAGRVGTGGHEWETIKDRLVEIKKPGELDTKNAPNAELQRATWVEPVFVVQVAFQRWTEDGRLVHPSVKRLREDKAARDVRREG